MTGAPNTKRETVAFARSLGFTVQEGRKHEHVIDPSSGRRVAVMPKSPKLYGVGRTHKNLIATLRRASKTDPKSGQGGSLPGQDSSQLSLGVLIIPIRNRAHARARRGRHVPSTDGVQRTTSPFRPDGRRA